MSSTSLMMERSHFEVGIAAVADFGDTAQNSDVINLSRHKRARAIIHWGVGATGTQTLTVTACDDVTPSNETAIPFWYRITVAAADPGAITRATASGFTTTAGSNQIVELEIVAADLAVLGRKYFRIKMTEVVNSPLLGGIIIELLEPRHAGSTQYGETV